MSWGRGHSWGATSPGVPDMGCWSPHFTLQPQATITSLPSPPAPWGDGQCPHSQTESQVTQLPQRSAPLPSQRPGGAGARTQPIPTALGARAEPSRCLWSIPGGAGAAAAGLDRSAPGGGRRRSNRRRLAPLSPGNPSPSNGGFFTARDEELKVIFSPGCESIGSSIRCPAGCRRGGPAGRGARMREQRGLSRTGSPPWHGPQGPPGICPSCAHPRAQSPSLPNI